MTPVSRRDFLTQSAAAVGVLAAGNTLARASLQPTTRIKSGADVVTLGRTGIKTSVLGMGTGSTGVARSSNQVKLGQEKFIKLVRHAYDQGVRYFDVADQYGSHYFMRDALKGLPREQLYIQTKSRARTADVLRADVERFREELGVDYIDTLLMHCMTEGGWPTDFRPVMDALSEAKAKKWVRAVGVSCHGMAPLRSAVKTDWVDIDLARINPVGEKVRMDGPPEQVVPCLQAMHGAGKGVIGMKIYGEGTFTTREERLHSLRFVLGLGCVDAFCIGFEKPEQIDETMQLIEEAVKG